MRSTTRFPVLSNPRFAAPILIYIALPIGVTLDLLPEIAQNAAPHALVTDACSTKMRICNPPRRAFLREESTPIFLGGHPMAGRELSGFAQSDADLFRNAPTSDRRFVGAAPIIRRTIATRASMPSKILEKLGARPRGSARSSTITPSALLRICRNSPPSRSARFSTIASTKTVCRSPLAGPGLRDTLRLAGSSYATWRDIVLTNREVLSAALDLFARRLDDLRERLGSRELEADFDAANELYKLLRSL